MYYDVKKVTPAGPRQLRVEFADGLKGTIAIHPSFCINAFEPLLDDEVVHQAKVRHGAVTWFSELDLAPDTMHSRIQGSPKRRYDIRYHGVMW